MSLFTKLLPFLYFIANYSNCAESNHSPIVINTWNFADANKNAFSKLLSDGGRALDAVEIGCQTCERLQCDGTVGFGGSPDENGETTLDALIMDGKTMNIGAVGALRNVKNAVSVARHVLEYTEHSFLVGSQATDFAVSMGFSNESLSTNKSKSIWESWKSANCQPNFWENVTPNSKNSCGPYKPLDKINPSRKNFEAFGTHNHDTIGMVALDQDGNMAVATSTNGARHKIPGRVGDSPIIGSGGYVENGVGGAVATGDGDILMRFLPSFKAIESLKSGLSPEESAQKALENIGNYYPKFVGAVVVLSSDGRFGAACHGMTKFPFSVSAPTIGVGQIREIKCPPSGDANGAAGLGLKPAVKFFQFFWAAVIASLVTLDTCI